MLNRCDSLRELADRARRGELDAAHRLYERVAPQVRRIVRRVIRARNPRSELEQSIFSDAEHLVNQCRCAQLTITEEELVLQVSRQVCDRLYQRVMQTISPTWSVGACDTVMHHCQPGMPTK